MEVTFTKVAGRRYMMTVVRERGPRLAPRQGPGYDDHLPHDAVHFLVEAEAGLAGGVFGRVAAGQGNIFWVADPGARRRQARRETLDSPLVERILGRLDQFAAAWEALPDDGSITVPWPPRLVTRPGRSAGRRGRRSARTSSGPGSAREAGARRAGSR